jgi:hypothetical protein
MTTLSEIAWAAGLFEGEGTVSKGPKVKAPTVALMSSDRDVVDRFASIVGFGSVRAERIREPGRKRLYRWASNTWKGVTALFELLGGQLGNRRRATFEHVLAQRPERWGDQKDHATCRNGHPYTPENTSVSPEGWRRCRTCRRHAQRRYASSGCR